MLQIYVYANIKHFELLHQFQSSLNTKLNLQSHLVFCLFVLYKYIFGIYYLLKTSHSKEK